jgi:hypothetical protein
MEAIVEKFDKSIFKNKGLNQNLKQTFDTVLKESREKKHLKPIDIYARFKNRLRESEMKIDDVLLRDELLFLIKYYNEQELLLDAQFDFDDENVMIQMLLKRPK